MTKRTGISRRLAARGARLLIATLAAASLIGCATGGTTTLHPGERVQVDGAPVTIIGNQTVLDVLRRGTFASRIGELAPKHDRPLVVIDGVVQVDGQSALGLLPAVQVGSVTTMRGVHAVARYGPIAQAGAIIVQTRRTAQRP